MLMLTGAATKVRIKEAQEYSKRLHKAFEPAFILDSFAEERLNEMTIDTTRAEIKYKDLAFAFIDVPGHEELIKNMISGASYGEVALLLVSAKKDEGIRDQTKRHLYIARMLGIDKLLVAVNKMDTVSYKESTFENVKNELSQFIEKIGFEKSKTLFIPISAYKGDNLVKKSANLKWYNGSTLVDAIYKNAKSEGRNQSGALRMITQGGLDDSRLVLGKVISGSVHMGEKVSLLPTGGDAVVKEIIVKGKKTRAAGTGLNVALRLDRSTKAELRGTVISSSNSKPALKDRIKARVFVTGRIGKDLSIKFNGVDIGCKSLKILNGIDVTTGERTASKTAEPLNAMEAELSLEKKIPVEAYETTRELGRFVLYSNSVFAGIGIIK